MVVKVEKELFVFNHLGLSVQEHSSCLSKVLARVKEVAHSVVMERFSDILENVDSVDDDALSGLEEELFGVEESFCHSLDLLIVMMVNLPTVVEHVANI